MRQLRAGELDVRIYDDLAELARAAATDAVAALGTAIDARGEANVLLATGNSQLAFLAELVTRRDVDWTAVTAFHMDEYAGLPPGHAASFQRYMRERVAAHLPLRAFHYLDGTNDPEAEAQRYADLLAAHPLDLCCAGIGENGHLAFNDPPVADFDDPETVKVIALEDASRRQQVGEGHFATIDDVPTRADHGHDPGSARRPARARDRPRVTKGEAGTGHARGADLDRVPGHVPPDPVARLALPGSRSSRAHRRPLVRRQRAARRMVDQPAPVMSSASS